MFEIWIYTIDRAINRSFSRWNLWIYSLQMEAKPVKNVSSLLSFSSHSELETELLGTLFLPLLLETGPPFYVVIPATRRSSHLQGQRQYLHFSVILRPWGLVRSQESTLDLPLCSQALYRLSYRIYSINRPGRLLNFWTLRVGAYLRWALIRGWALIKFSVFLASVVCLFCNKTINGNDKTRRCNKVRFL